MIYQGDLTLRTLVKAIHDSTSLAGHGRNAIVVQWDENDDSATPITRIRCWSSLHTMDAVIGVHASAGRYLHAGSMADRRNDAMTTCSEATRALPEDSTERFPQKLCKSLWIRYGYNLVTRVSPNVLAFCTTNGHALPFAAVARSGV